MPWKNWSCALSYWASYLKVLPAAATGEVFHNQAVVCPSRRAIPVSSPAPIPTTTTTTTTSSSPSSTTTTFKVTRTGTVRVGNQLKSSQYTTLHLHSINKIKSGRNNKGGKQRQQKLLKGGKQTKCSFYWTVCFFQSRTLTTLTIKLCTITSLLGQRMNLRI